MHLIVSIRSPRRNEGRLDPFDQSGRPDQVSIRSPRRNEGRPLHREISHQIGGGFNPLPPSKRGETAWHNLGRLSCRCFNPLPPSKRGETRKDWYKPVETEVSIRSPRRNEGRLWPGSSGGETKSVSIRSPRRNEGRPRIDSGHTHRPTFQSAPPVETRGDPSSGSRGRRVPCFNPLPPSKRGETPSISPNCSPLLCFNPLPPSKRGETGTRRHKLRPSVVSIRSPRRNEGRLPGWVG